MGSAKRIAAAAAVFISCAALLAFVFDEDDSNKTTRPDELLSPLEVGLYAVRAERESADYDKKAERQIAFATDNDNAASAESQLAAKEEKRARQSAFLAADVKSRIDRVLEEGKDEVNQETKLKTKAASLQDESNKLLDDAKAAKDNAEALKAKYYSGMDDYNAAVTQIDDASKKAQNILDQMNAQSLVLAEVATQYSTATSDGQDPDSPAAEALKQQLQQAQTDLAAVSAQKDQALADSEQAGKLADQYQPVIVQAEQDKRASDLEFQKFSQATSEADELQNRADALVARAENIDTLVDETQEDLAKKRKEFEHYKNRAQTEMAISLQAEDKEALLRKEARDARLKAAQLSDKARALRALAQKGVNNVLESAIPPSSDAASAGA